MRSPSVCVGVCVCVGGGVPVPLFPSKKWPCSLVMSPVPQNCLCSLVLLIFRPLFPEKIALVPLISKTLKYLDLQPKNASSRFGSYQLHWRRKIKNWRTRRFRYGKKRSDVEIAARVVLQPHGRQHYPWPAHSHRNSRRVCKKASLQISPIVIHI